MAVATMFSGATDEVVVSDRLLIKGMMYFREVVEEFAAQEDTKKTKKE
jgi:hypothetical protein